MIDWQVALLRFTLFRSTPIETVMPLWEILIGNQPEKRDFQPRVNRIVEAGTIVLGSLTHTSDPFSINWVLSPSPDQQQETPSYPTLGPLPQIKDQFINLMNNWLPSEALPETNRIALGSIAVIPHNNKASAYKQLSALLHHVQIDVENSTDLLYQINRPIQSTVEPGLAINRLTKWSAVRVLELGFLALETPQLMKDTKGFIATQLELDINTSQYNKNPISKDKLVPLLHEFSQLADRISADGDNK